MLTLKEPGGRGSSSRRGGRPGDAKKQQSSKRAQPAQKKRRPPSPVPKQDAFSNLPKRRPPNLPGYEEEWADYQRRKQEAGGDTRTGGHTAPPDKPDKKKTSKDRSGRDGPSKTAGGADERRKQQQRNQRAKRPVSPARRRRNRRLAAILAIVIVICAGVGICFGFLFNIESYTIQGESPYTKEEIVAAFHPREGDNMFSFSAAEEARAIEQALPYLAEVKIRRRLPSNIVFQVTVAGEKYSMAQGEQVAILSDSRKVLRFADAAPEGLTEIRGLEGVKVEPGFPLTADETAATPAPASSAASSTPPPADSAAGSDTQAADDTQTSAAEGGDSGSAAQSSEPAGEANAGAEEETKTTGAERLELLDTLLAALDASGLGDITWVDVSDPLDLRFRWQDRITVKLGPKGDIDQRLKYIVVLFIDPNRGQISQEDKGVLDASAYPATDKVWLSPE